MQALFGTRTAADINLAAQLLILAGLLVGFALARRKRFAQHANVQTTMVLINLLLILLIMGVSFYDYVIDGGTTTGRVAQLMIVHAALGILAEGAAIYLILRMRTELIPPSLRVENFKLVMRATLTLWTALVVLGIGIYVERYLVNRTAVSAPLSEFRQLGADLYVHAVELDDALTRGSEAGVQRHAEHLINLIEGSQGLHYGDNDIDGHLEDPGDGVGLLARLDDVAGVTDDPAVTAQADVMRGQLDEIVTRTIDLLGDQPLENAAPDVADVLQLARQANAEGVFQIDAAANATGVVQAPQIAAATAAAGTENSITIREKDFAFAPTTMTAPAGTTVVWINDDPSKHTVTADDDGFESGDQNLGESFSYTFTEPGSYPYYCRFHGDKGVGMAGTIIVE